MIINKKDIKLHARSGDFRVYKVTGIDAKVEIKLCLAASLYVNAGYYLTLGQGLSSVLMYKCYNSGKDAALAAFKERYSRK